MTKTFSIIFVILFVFIMILCAIQPIAFPHALVRNEPDKDAEIRLSIAHTEVGINRGWLMLDAETPLTWRYFKEHPDYVIHITPSAAGAVLTCGNFEYMALLTENIVNDLSYDYIATSWHKDPQNEAIIIDMPMYIDCDPNSPDTTYTIYTSWDYQENLLNRLLSVASHTFRGAQDIIDFVIDNPLILMSFGISLFALVIVLVKRLAQCGDII